MVADTMMLPDHKTGRVRSGDVEIFYRRFGQPGTTPIVIVHGLSYFSYDWIRVAADLARDREVVAIDMRGFGQSGWSTAHDYALRTLAADVIAVLDGLGWEQAILVGHSMGGRVCLLTADWYPERVAALVCLDFAPDLAPEGRKHVANSIGRQPDIFTTVDEALAYHGYDPALPADAPMRLRFEAFLKPVAGGWQLRRDLHYRDKFRAVLETGRREPEKADPWAALKALELPVLVVRGARSNLFAAETMDKVRAANSRARVIEIQGGHNLADDNPDGVVAAVDGFLRENVAG